MASPSLPVRLKDFLRELKRRKVYRVGVAYLVVTFVVLQLAELAAGAFDLPGWFEPMVWVLCGLGFPIALVLAWAFDLTPEGVERTPAGESEPRPGDEPTRTGIPIAAKGLVALGLLSGAAAGVWYLIGSIGQPTPEISERTVAVLPFEVSGSGAEEWRDGMVTMLSIGLDGAADFRAIADRTVFAEWRGSVEAEGGATTEEALTVARRIGARYAVVGSAVGLGSELRFAADVHATDSGDRLGHAEVQGSPDSVTALADELTRRVIALLAAETGQGLRSADLASVTTRSLPALRSYLEGQQHLRAGESGAAAIEDFEAAIEADSTFALPHARIALLGLWRHEAQGEFTRRAYELADQLPERERRLVGALYLGRIEHRTLAAADSLRQLTRDYPDDPSVWDTLGEFLFHAKIPGGLPEVEEAHERAIALDPANTSYYDHYVGPAFVLHHDSALAAQRVESVPEGEWKRMWQLGLDLVFGGPEERQRALDQYETVPIPEHWLAVGPPGHPEDRDLEHEVLRTLLERDDLNESPYDVLIILNDLDRGRIREAIRHLRDRTPELQGPFGFGLPCVLAYTMTLGPPVPDSVSGRYLEPENLPPDPSLSRLSCTGLYLIEQGRMDELDAVIGRIQAPHETNGSGPSSEEWGEARIEELRGYQAWKTGDLDRAARLWSRSNESNDPGALWRGNLYRELGRHREAEGWYLAAWMLPLAHERMGRLYEEMGRTEEATAAYHRFITAWEDADPELQDRVEEARERLQALTASEADTDD